MSRNSRLMTDLRERRKLQNRVQQRLNAPHFDDIGRYSRRARGTHIIKDLQPDVEEHSRGNTDQIGQNARLHQQYPDYDNGLMTAQQASSHIDNLHLGRLHSSGKYHLDHDQSADIYRYHLKNRGRVLPHSSLDPFKATRAYPQVGTNSSLPGVPSYAYVPAIPMYYGEDMPLMERLDGCPGCRDLQKRLDMYHDMLLFAIAALAIWSIVKDKKSS